MDRQEGQVHRKAFSFGRKQLTDPTAFTMDVFEEAAFNLVDA
jgi:hypothetical protein